MSTNCCHHQATQSTSFQQVCASEIKINFETLTGFTCSAVYDTATSTTLPPVSSPSPVDGGTPTPIVQECTTISVLPQVPPSADATALPISTPPDVVKVPISLPIIIVSEDPYKKFSDIYAAPNALLPSRTDIGDYGFTSPRTGFGVVAPMKRRAPALASTTSFFNNAPASASPRRLRHAPVLDYHRGRRARPLPFPSRSQPTPASTPCHPRIWTTTTILRLILLTTRIDVATTPTVFSSPFRTTSSAFRTTRASATFIVVRMPF